MIRRTLALLSLVLAGATGCQGQAPPPGAAIAIGVPGGRPDPATVPKSGSFAGLDGAAGAPVSGSVPDPAVRGRVTTGEGDAARPVPDALVATSDGRLVRTDADGAFAIAGAWPADGGLVVSGAGYAASGVAGVTGAEPLDVHLRPLAAVSDAVPAAAEAPFALRGLARRADGSPAAGVVVSLVDARGAFAAPAVADGAGAFTLQVFAPGREVADATLLASGGGWIGLKAGVAAKAGAEAVAEAAVELQLGAADRTVEAAIDAAPGGATPALSLELAVPGGVLGLPPEADGRWRVAALPDVSYALRAGAIDPATGAESQLYRPGLALDAATVRVAEAMLAPPEPALNPAIVLNEALTWPAVPGATGYSLALSGLDAGGFLWEAWTDRPTLPLSYQGAVPAGLYTLTLTAWDVAGATPRSVASAPRRLRLPDGQSRYRRASRSFRVQV